MTQIALCGDNSTNNFANFTTSNTNGNDIHLVTGVNKITTNITINNHVFFSSGASLTIDGCTVTFAGGVSGPKSQIFTYANSGVVIFSDKQECPAEWWGAKNDGMTDSYAAIMAALGACSNVKLRGGTYYTSSTIKIAGFQKLEGIGRLQTTILKTTAGSDIVVLTPLSGYVAGTQATYAANPRLKELTVSRNTSPTTGAAFDANCCTGVRVLGTNGFEITNVTSENSTIGFYFGATNGGFVTNSLSQRSLGGTTDQYIGYYFDGLSTDGTTGSPNSSLRVMNSVMSNSISNNKSAYGYYFNGHIADVWLERPENSKCYRGFFFDGPGGTTDKYVPDVHIFQPTSDLFYNNGIFAQNINQYGQVQIYGGFCAPDPSATSPAGVYLQSCIDGGVIISDGHQVWGTNHSACMGFLLNTCYGIEVDINAKDCSPPVQIWGMKESRLTGIIRNNSIATTNAVEMDAATGPLTTHGNYFDVSIRGASGKITNGYKLNQSIGAPTKNEFHCTMIDAGSVTNKLNDNGTAITASGGFGASGNSAAGVMT